MSAAAIPSRYTRGFPHRDAPQLASFTDRGKRTLCGRHCAQARDQHAVSAWRTGTYRRFPVDHRDLNPQTVPAGLVGPAILVSDEAIGEMAGPVRRGARHPTQMREYKRPSTSLWTVRNQVIIFRQMFEFAVGKP